MSDLNVYLSACLSSLSMQITSIYSAVGEEMSQTLNNWHFWEAFVDYPLAQQL